METKPITILLTGGTGFLGSHMLAELLANSMEVILLKRTTSNLSRIKGSLDKITSYDLDVIDVKKVFDEHTIDTILHCATDYGRKNADPMQIIEANLILPVKLIELGKSHGVIYFINTDTLLEKRVSHYSLSKKQFNDWLKGYSNEMCCINVALEHFYGPGDDQTKFVSRIIRQLLENQEKIDLTPGEQRRDFVYIDDVVSGFMTIINNREHFSNGYFEFEIGSGHTISIKNLMTTVKKIMKNTKTALNFGALPYRENEVMNSSVNLTSISKLGWVCRNSLEQGLKKTIEFEAKNAIV